MTGFQRLRVLFAAALLLASGCGEDPYGSYNTSPDCVAEFGDGYVCRIGLCERGCDTAHDCEFIGEGHMCMADMCMGMDTEGVDVLQPEPTEADTEMVPLTDLDPDPGVFEATLVAAVGEVEIVPGTMTEAWVYKEIQDHVGTIPGPFIDVTIGTLIRITSPSPPRSTGTGSACPWRWTASPTSPIRRSNLARATSTSTSLRTPRSSGTTPTSAPTSRWSAA